MKEKRAASPLLRVSGSGAGAGSPGPVMARIMDFPGRFISCG